MYQPGFRFAKANANDSVAEAMGMLAARTIAGERAYYTGLWPKLTITAAQHAATMRYVRTVMEPNRRRYEEAGKTAGTTPWYVVAIIHALEGSSDFSTHLHNGDPLTRRTVHVPEGRPLGTPPFSWEESAADALTETGVAQQDDWSIEGICFALEAYNGFGYRPRGINSPYLFAQSNLWTRGKFVSDGRYDPNAGSSQIGGLVFLRVLIDAGLVDLKDQKPNPTPTLPDRPDLQRGDFSPWVEVLQHTLNGSGYGPLTVDGDFGPATHVEVLEFQKDTGLFVDGVVGQETWPVLIAHAKLPGWRPLSEVHNPPAPTAGSRARVLAIAREWASKGRSHSPGSWIDTHVLDPLRQPMIDLGHLPIGDRDSFWNWCAGWTTAVLREAGIEIPDKFSGEWATVALVDAWRGWAKRNGAWVPVGTAKPLPGDIVIYDWDGDTFSDHIGFVLEAHSWGVLAAEGNRRNQESIVERPVGDIQGYVRLETLLQRLG